MFVLNAANMVFRLLQNLLGRIHSDIENRVVKFSPPLRIISYVVKKALHKTEKTAIQKTHDNMTCFTYLT